MNELSIRLPSEERAGVVRGYFGLGAFLLLGVIVAIATGVMDGLPGPSAFETGVMAVVFAVGIGCVTVGVRLSGEHDDDEVPLSADDSERLSRYLMASDANAVLERVRERGTPVTYAEVNPIIDEVRLSIARRVNPELTS